MRDPGTRCSRGGDGAAGPAATAWPVSYGRGSWPPHSHAREYTLAQIGSDSCDSLLSILMDSFPSCDSLSNPDQSAQEAPCECRHHQVGKTTFTISLIMRFCLEIYFLLLILLIVLISCRSICKFIQGTGLCFWEYSSTLSSADPRCCNLLLSCCFIQLWAYGSMPVWFFNERILLMNMIYYFFAGATLHVSCRN